MTEAIKRIEELIKHYRKAKLYGEVFGLRVALDVLKRVERNVNEPRNN